MSLPRTPPDLRPVAPPTPRPEPHDPGEPASTVRARVAGLQGYGVVALAVVIIVAALEAAQGFFVPVIVGLVIALALSRIVRRLERWIPRWIAAVLVVSLLVGCLGALAYGLSDETARAIAELPRATRVLRQALRVMLNRNEGSLGQLQKAISELQKTATESTDRPSTPSGVLPVQVVEPPLNFSNMVWLGSQGVLWVAAQLTLVMFLVYFLLAYGDLFKRKFVRLSGEKLSQRKITVQLIEQIVENVQKSLSHLLVAGLAVGVATWGALVLLHVSYPGLWGVAAGVLNCVPYLGPLAVAVGLLLASLVQFGDLGTAAIVAGVSIVITTVEGFLFTPVVFGRSASLNPVAIFIAFLFWGWMWGIWGMLLAMPLLMIIRTIAESVDELAPLAELLSD